MQDIHWAWGEMGYFATYTLGNLYSAAIAETMRAELDLDELVARPATSSRSCSGCASASTRRAASARATT